MCQGRLFLAAVSSLWRSLYARHAAREMQTAGIYKRPFTCTSRMTLYSSLFASPSRVKYAHANGLRCSAQGYKFAAGQFGIILSLMAACELGMEYSVATMMGAAESNQLPVETIPAWPRLPLGSNGIACCCKKRRP
jgi:hypothetical protein